MRLLLIEDNERLATLISDGLTREGFGVDHVRTVADAQHALATTHFSAIILDLGLPDGDGLTVVHHLRRRGIHTPLLILTARQRTEDKVRGIEAGADDYLGKPFAFEELLVRIRALLRRPAEFLGTTFTAGNLTFDTLSREILVNDTRHPVPPREAALLQFLLQRAGQVVPKKLLEDSLYGLSAEGSSNAIEVYIHRLRRLLVDVGAQVSIETVRGVGYFLNLGRSA